MTATSLQGLVSLILLLVLVAVIVVGAILAITYWANHRAALLRWWDAHMTAEERAVLLDLAQTAVAAVRAFASGPVGQADIAASVKLVTTWLAARGLEISAGEIEAAVVWALGQLAASGVLTALPAAAATAPIAPAAPS